MFGGGGVEGGGVVRVSLKKVFMDKKYINAKRILDLCMDRCCFCVFCVS